MAGIGPTQARAAWAAVGLALLVSPGAYGAAVSGVIPLPAAMQPAAGTFALGASSIVRVSRGDTDAFAAARYLTHMLERSRGLKLAIGSSGPTPKSIEFVRSRELAPEGYEIEVTPERIRVAARTAAGLFYGAVTLWQLLPPGTGPGEIAAQHIRDAPLYSWRGLMLDSVRHFQSAGFIYSMLEWMAWHKLNVLHWHLTDDQGWRLQIRRYPRLTDIGAWRVPTGSVRRYGGFYTQAQVRDIVAFAASRHIRIVPEIEMPGHAQAAVAAYPELGSIAGDRPSVSTQWGVHPYLFNVEPATFNFLENVLDEVLGLFPNREVHIGGDEALKDQWIASPIVQSRMKALGIRDAEQLQGYFTTRIATYLARRGRRAVGWDEILTPAVPRDAIIMSWRGASGARAAALAGNDAVLAPSPTLYFDNRQSTLPSEPPGRMGLVTLEDVYHFDARDPSLSKVQGAHILGVQGNLWTEHIQTEDRLEWMALPRALAVAEIGWTRPEERSWSGFVARLEPTFVRERALGVRMADSMFAIASEIHPSKRGIKLTLTDQASLPIHYTIDGSQARPDSPVFAAPLEVPDGTLLDAATFAGGTRLSPLATLRLERASLARRDSRQLELCSSAIPLLLESSAVAPGQGPIFALDIVNPCWLYRQANLEHGAHVRAAVAPLPFNFELGSERAKVRTGDARTALGELEVHLDSCDGAELARLPLRAPSADEPTADLVPADLPARPGTHDLCLRIARPQLDPLWALNWVEVKP